MKKLVLLLSGHLSLTSVIKADLLVVIRVKGQARIRDRVALPSVEDRDRNESDKEFEPRIRTLFICFDLIAKDVDKFQIGNT